MFREMKPCTFRPQPSKLFPKKSLIFFPKKKALWKNFLYFLKRKLFLYLRKKSLQFLLEARKVKGIHPGQIYYILRNGNPKKISHIFSKESCYYVPRNGSPNVYIYFNGYI